MSNQPPRESSITDTDFDRMAAHIRRRGQQRRAQAPISVSAIAYEKLKQAADSSGMSMRKIVEAACSPEKLAELQECINRASGSP